MNPDPIVRIESVSKRFENVLALDSLDLAIAPGQFLTLLGPSGCGKSTTLRLLGGFEQPDSGRILLGGEDVTRLPPNRRDVNMVFQDYALFPHMTVGQNVAFGLELKGQSREQIAARSKELFEFLQLTELAARRPDQLSGGQRQRAALARALAPDPKVLLLDEPLGALDAKLRSQVQVELKGIQQRTGKTFIFVTHDQEEALTMSDRIVVMSEGRVMQDGTPEELYYHPQNRFVADFVGETNLLDCTVREESGDDIVLDWRGTTLHARPHGGAMGLSAGQRVEVALRPESIQCFAGRPDLPNAVAGRITARVFRGSRLSVTVAVGEGNDTLKASLDPFLGDHLEGEELWLGWRPERLAVLRG